MGERVLPLGITRLKKRTDKRRRTELYWNGRDSTCPIKGLPRVLLILSYIPDNFRLYRMLLYPKYVLSFVLGRLPLPYLGDSYPRRPESR